MRNFWRRPTCLAVVVVGAVASSPASASSSFGVNAKPSRVVFEPAAPAAATAVRIVGLIALGGTTQDFVTPACGYLYYTCKAGDEALCREQWQDLAAAAQAGQCVLFTTRRDGTGMLANVGRLRPLDEAPAGPDIYSARSGLGVMTMVCGPEFSATCGSTGGAGGKGGAAGAGGSGAGGVGGSGAGGTASGGNGGGGNAGVAGMAGAGQSGATGGTTTMGSGGTPAGGTGGTPTAPGNGGAGGTSATVDAGQDAAPDASGRNSKSGGCSVLGADATSGAGLAATALALALVHRRRRRGDA
jgi:MYXO-CTERM domain-containing protein